MNSMMLQNMMNQKIKEDIDPKNQISLNLFFEISSLCVVIQCLPSQTVSEVIKKFREKSGITDPHAKFLLNGRELVEYLTVAESGLIQFSKIVVETSNNIVGSGGFPISFSDVSKNKTKELPFSNKAPSYRKVSKGINIFGTCKFKKCVAYQKEVVVRIKKQKFDLIEERNDLFCPKCEALIVPKTVGFYLCKFKIYGKKLEDGQEQAFRNESDEARNKNTLKYFDPELSGNIMITQLIFEVEKYF